MVVVSVNWTACSLESFTRRIRGWKSEPQTEQRGLHGVPCMARPTIACVCNCSQPTGSMGSRDGVETRDLIKDLQAETTGPDMVVLHFV